MTYHRTSEHTSKSLKPGFTALYCGSFCWMLLHCFQIAHSLVLLPRSPHIRLIRSASLACLNKGWKTAFRSSYLSLARSLRITHAIRDPKIPILPTQSERYSCSELSSTDLNVYNYFFPFKSLRPHVLTIQLVLRKKKIILAAYTHTHTNKHTYAKQETSNNIQRVPQGHKGSGFLLTRK